MAMPDLPETVPPASPRSDTPRYQQIAGDLVARLARGDYAIGDQLPTELELSAEYGVSRTTLREAMRTLESLGLVQRRQGAGTTIIALQPGDSFTQEITNLEQLLQYPGNTRLFVLGATLIRPDPALAQRLGIPENQEWLRIEGIRRVRITAAPICFATIYIRPEYADAIDDIGTTSGPVYTLIARRYGLSVLEVDLDILAGTVPASHAALLQVEPGTPGLSIIRRYRDEQNQVFEISDSLHPAGRFTYRLNVRRARPP